MRYFKTTDHKQIHIHTSLPGVWHWTPPNPGKQSHTNPSLLLVLVHTPPFKQGLLSHGGSVAIV